MVQQNATTEIKEFDPKALNDAQRAFYNMLVKTLDERGIGEGDKKELPTHVELVRLAPETSWYAMSKVMKALKEAGYINMGKGGTSLIRPLPGSKYAPKVARPNTVRQVGVFLFETSFEHRRVTVTINGFRKEFDITDVAHKMFATLGEIVDDLRKMNE